MAEQELTNDEKAALLVQVDFRNPDDYDKEFYEALKSIEFPGPDNLDGRTRRALLKFVNESFTETLGGLLATGALHIPAVKAIMMTCLVTGYELGRKLHQSLSQP